MTFRRTQGPGATETKSSIFFSFFFAVSGGGNLGMGFRLLTTTSLTMLLAHSEHSSPESLTASSAAIETAADNARCQKREGGSWFPRCAPHHLVDGTTAQLARSLFHLCSYSSYSRRLSFLSLASFSFKQNDGTRHGGARIFGRFSCRQRKRFLRRCRNHRGGPGGLHGQPIFKLYPPLRLGAVRKETEGNEFCRRSTSSLAIPIAA